MIDDIVELQYLVVTQSMSGNSCFGISQQTFVCTCMTNQSPALTFRLLRGHRSINRSAAGSDSDSECLILNL